MWVSENKTMSLLRLKLFLLSADWHALRFHSGSGAESWWLSKGTPLKFALQYPQPTLLGVFWLTARSPLIYSIWCSRLSPSPDLSVRTSVSRVHGQKLSLDLPLYFLCSRLPLWRPSFQPLDSPASVFSVQSSPGAAPLLKCSSITRESRTEPDLLVSSCVS